MANEQSIRGALRAGKSAAVAPLVTSILAGMVLGAAVPSPYVFEPPRLAAALERQAERLERRGEANDPHGATSQLEVVPIFNSLEVRAGAASGIFHVEVDNLHDVELRVAYAWHIEDDLGVRIADGESKDVGRLSARGLYMGQSWKLPGLKDGFYRVIVTLVSLGARQDAGGTTVVRDWWLEVAGGQIQEIDEEEWYGRSLGSLAQEEEK
jgi:hypothetical protein